MAQPSSAGIHGTAGSLPLVDLLQVWSMNRFSGLVTVTQGGRGGQVYFVEGEVVHAEADAQTGEAAFREIVAWPDGAFNIFPNTTTLHRTIQKRMSHLLLDAHRVLDEAKRDGRTPAPAAAPAPAGREGGKVNVFDQIRAIRGVTQVARFGADGRPAGGSDPGAERLAAMGLYLAMNHASAVASAFGLRDLTVATLQTEKEPFVLVHSGGAYLCVGVAPDVPADLVAAQVRALLTRPAGR